jgi:DNA-directed RNA polymerase subunit F
MVNPVESELKNLTDEEKKNLDVDQKILLAHLRIMAKLDERERYKKALEEILTDVKTPPYTSTGRKAYIRSVCEIALEKGWED